MTSQVAHSPLSMDDLDLLKQTVGLSTEDEGWLRRAGDVLADQAEEMVDAWRAELAQHPPLAKYSAHPDGRPNPEYSAASKPRFVRWILDTCTRPYDQAWLDYQHEIGLRHTRAKKNQTDGADSVDHVPMRYVLAFTAVVLVSGRRYLARKGHPEHEVEHMHAAWIKSVMLHVTVWTRAYVPASDW